MNNLKELIVALNNDESIKRYKELEYIIDHDKNLKKEYELLKELQKKLVRAENTKNAKLSDIRSEYDVQYEIVKNHVLLEEYIDLLESINNDVQMIQNIISDEINMDVD